MNLGVTVVLSCLKLSGSTRDSNTSFVNATWRPSHILRQGNLSSTRAIISLRIGSSSSSFMIETIIKPTSTRATISSRIGSSPSFMIETIIKPRIKLTKNKITIKQPMPPVFLTGFFLYHSAGKSSRYRRLPFCIRDMVSVPFGSSLLSFSSLNRSQHPMEIET